MARIPVIGFDPAVQDGPLSFTFTAHARQSGKTSAARDAWERHANCRNTSTYDARTDWIDAGIVADPITVTDRDLRTAAREDLDALAAGVWLPGVTATSSFEGGRRVVRIAATTPCVTSLS
jgi:hypothetical protein